MNTIIIPQRGQRHLTNRLVNQIRRFESNYVRIIVVDDNRDLRPLQCNCELVQNEGSGWTDAINTGIAMCDGSQSVLLLNNDVEASAPFTRLFRDVESPMTLLGANMRIESSLGSHSHLLKSAKCLEGWCLWLHPSVRDVVPFFDHSMMTYFSDLDYQMCCIGQGIALREVPGLPLKHIGRQTTSKTEGIQERWDADRHAFIRKWKDA